MMLLKLYCFHISAHIFFDNAMENHNELEKDYTVNEYVALLVEVLKEAAKYVNFNYCFKLELKNKTYL